MKRILTIIVAVALLGYIVFALFIVQKPEHATVCKNIEVVVKDSLEKHFVDRQDIISMLVSANMSPVSKRMSEINTYTIQELLLKNEMISKANVYKTPSGLIRIEITQKIPLLRVINSRESFYVDNNGETMPVSSRYVPYIPVATGSIEKSFAMNDLYKFALYLHKNEFWNNQIEQIFVHPNKEVELTPRVGDQRIILGTLDNFEKKLDKLKLFYDQVIPKFGWDKYKAVNLKFEDQVVCTKK